MKKHYFLVVFAFLSACCNVAHAQLVGGSGYLQGAWLEIGLSSNDAFGTTAPPAGYHPHCPGCWPTYTSVPPFGLAEVYDYGHDGWAVGAPPSMGDYTLPGSPFEGWEMQVNGTRMQQYASPAFSGTPYTASGAASMTGTSFPYYTNTSGSARVGWAGTYTTGAITLNIKQETRVDTFASAVTVTTKIYNTSAVPAPGVYYWRSCDPDNDETWSAYGGMFPTHNVINAQNDVDHRVSVTGTGYSTTAPPMTLATKDCRCVAVIYNSWGLTATQDLAAVWNQTYGPSGVGAYYNVGVDHPGDIGIGLVCNIGTIPQATALFCRTHIFSMGSMASTA